MKIIGIFILILELIALALQLHSECKKNNFTANSFKIFIDNLLSKLKPKPKPKPTENTKFWKRRYKK